MIKSMSILKLKGFIMKEKNSKTGLIVFLVALVVCIGAAVYIGKTLYERWEEQKAYEELKNQVATTTEKKEEVVISTEFTGEMDGAAVDIPDDVLNDAKDNPVDFEKLQSYNKELVAWVRVPNTNIDYPVGRHEGEDQSYYLSHDMYQDEAYAGCIYMEDINSPDFTDPNTIFYGHNMKNGSMFKTLHLFEDKKFFDKQRYFYVYTPGHILIYEIFAAYDVDDIYIPGAYNFCSTDEDFQRYLDDIMTMRSMGANMIDGLELDLTDRILTMSTCIGGQPDRRYLVQGVLRDDVESK